MEKITTIHGTAVPLAMNDIDTDVIIPAQYLTSTAKTGYGKYLFSNIKRSDKNFPFNQQKFQHANIMITQNNFGCGSSREHAVWALKQGGIQAIIAHSFADIFYNNSAKNGLVLIKLPDMTIKTMCQSAISGEYKLMIDLERKQITTSHHEVITFTLDPFRHYCFVNGLDDLAYLRAHQNNIQQHKRHSQAHDFLSITETDVVMAE